MIHKDCWKPRRVNFQLELRSFEFLYTCLAVARAESDFKIKMATDVRSGGVAVIHKDCWKPRRVNFQLELRSFEFLCARIDVKPTSILVVTIYRSQPISESFFQDFKKLLEKLVTFRCPITVVGISISTWKIRSTPTLSSLTSISNCLGSYSMLVPLRTTKVGSWTFSLLGLINLLLRSLCMLHLSLIVL